MSYNRTPRSQFHHQPVPTPVQTLSFEEALARLSKATGWSREWLRKLPRERVLALYGKHAR